MIRVRLFGQWIKAHWLMASIIAGSCLALIVVVTATGVAGAGVAVSAWAVLSGWLWNLNRIDESQRRQLNDARNAHEREALANALIVRDCLRELSNQFLALVSILETTAPQDWSSAERADFSRRFVDFASRKEIITRLRHAVRWLKSNIDTEADYFLSMMNIVGIGDSALGFTEEAAVYDRNTELAAMYNRTFYSRNWVDFDYYLMTWRELESILWILRQDDFSSHHAQLRMVVNELKEYAPLEQVVELAEQACAEIATSIGG